MSQQTQGAAPPSSARELRSPAALALADLAAIFDDLQFVLRCCERLITELERDSASSEQDDLVIESLWVAALTSYARCFRPGERGMGLAVTDLSATGLKGDVVEWHSLLGKLRNFYVDSNANPRELFSVGVSQSDSGTADGIVITSIVQPQVDETTVRQTGRLAFELSRLVDDRIKTQQKTVFTAAQALSPDNLNELPPIAVST
ncbi:hypothetical protein [Amycolatopsis sp.]|jgi:hypothetical protein|uniref:hypothetical protein n=1 Tax=Amycolatopsis sp. TaxID=37632 RepID=UPI002E032AFD|nr:hypothetical protein [Amycolatopsis sp.]